MARPKLTIGMATYDDYHGCYFTIQALRMYHPMQDIEILVIDNKPDSPGSETLRNQMAGMSSGHTPVRYVAAPEVVGTSAPRNRVFEEATGEAVLCIDSHVLLFPGVVQRLLDYYAAHPNTRDLLSGPLVYDTLGNLSTHFDPVWRSEMWGTWGSAWAPVCAVDGPRDVVSVIEERGRVKYVTLDMQMIPLTSSARCKTVFPDIAWPGHEIELLRAGWTQLGFDENAEFSIPGQGLGLFSCRKEAWLGFNEDFRGFGGEELYIHEKFRQHGARCLCLGFLKWVHRFGRPDGVKYPLTRWNKIRNYVLGHLELGLDIQPIYDHFVAAGLMPPHEWDQLIADPRKPMPLGGERLLAPQAQKKEATLDDLYEAVRNTPRDMEKHFPLIRRLANNCDQVTEFSKRKESLVAIAAAPRVANLHSYNTEADHPIAKEAERLYKLRVPDAMGMIKLEKKTSAQVDRIPTTDMLFIDSTHAYAVLAEELRKFGNSVRRYIVMHDTALHGERGEDGGLGLLQAIKEFVGDQKEWFVMSHTNEQYGMTVLSREIIDRPANKMVLWPPGFGPGTELSAMLATIGIVPDEHCDCKAKARQMDFWGVEGCKEHRDEIIKWMREGHTRWNWYDKLQAAAKAVSTGLAFKIDFLDPFPSIIDECIQRAAIKEAGDANQLPLSNV